MIRILLRRPHFNMVGHVNRNIFLLASFDGNRVGLFSCLPHFHLVGKPFSAWWPMRRGTVTSKVPRDAEARAFWFTYGYRGKPADTFDIPPMSKVPGTPRSEKLQQPPCCVSAQACWALAKFVNCVNHAPQQPPALLLSYTVAESRNASQSWEVSWEIESYTHTRDTGFQKSWYQEWVPDGHCLTPEMAAMWQDIFKSTLDIPCWFNTVARITYT